MSDQAKAVALRPLAVCHSYDDLRRAIVAFCADQGVTRQQLDLDAGLGDGHASKLLSPRTAQRALKRFGGSSFGRVLDALDLEIVLQLRADAEVYGEQPNNACDDASATPDAAAQIDRQPHPVDWRRKRGPGWGRRMAARRALLLTPEQRSASARTAARARWHHHNTE